MVIIGGGGLLHAHEQWSAQILRYCQVAGRCIVWSPGRNLHHARAAPMTPDNVLLQTAAAATVRDKLFANNARPLHVVTMLDASCLHPGLDGCSAPRDDRLAGLHPVAAYMHASQKSTGLGSQLKGLPHLQNSHRGNACPIFDFMCKALVLVSSSYHGALWGTYLGRRVLLPPQTFSEKFELMPFGPLPRFTTLESARLIAANGSLPNPDGLAVRDECRRQNKAFYKKHVEPFVRDVLQCSARPEKRAVAACEPMQAEDATGHGGPG